jgi:hypothetical protein
MSAVAIAEEQDVIPAEQESPVSGELIGPGAERCFSKGHTYPFTIPGPNGHKKCVVRFPTDEQWCTRIRHLVAVRRNLGRDAFKSESRGELETAKELLDKIIVETSGPALDEYDALTIVNLLSRCEITNVQEGPGVWRIVMRVPGSVTVTHRLKIPTQKQLIEQERAALQMTGRRNTVEFKSALEPSQELWDKIHDGVTGYDELASVSVIHKDIAVTELIAQVKNEIEKGINPEG